MLVKLAFRKELKDIELSSLEFFLEKAIAELNKAIEAARLLSSPRFYVPHYGSVVLHGIRPFCLDYDMSLSNHEACLTKQGFIFYLQRQDTFEDCSVTLCFYYDFEKGCLHHYFHPVALKSETKNYSDVYAIAKSSQLRDFVFDLPFIKSSWGILYHAYKEEPEKEIVSEEFLERSCSFVLSKGGCFWGYGSRIGVLRHVLPKWRLNLILDIHWCYDYFLLKKEENDVKNVNESATTTDDNTTAISS